MYHRLLRNFGILSALLGAPLAAQASPVAPQIVILQSIEHPALNQTRQGILDGLSTLSANTTVQSGQGNSSLSAQIAQQYVGLKPDILVGIGTSAAQALKAANLRYGIPLVFSSVTDPNSSQILGPHITGISNYVDPILPFQFFKEILPSLSTLGIVYNPGELNSVVLMKKMEEAASKLGIKLIGATAHSTTEVVQVTQSLMGKVDAIFINNDNTALSAFDSIVKVSNAYKVPVLVSDIDMIDQGALAALGPNQYEMGIQTAQLIQQILKGGVSEKTPIQYTNTVQSLINAEQATRLGLTLSPSVLKKYRKSQ